MDLLSVSAFTLGFIQMYGRMKMDIDVSIKNAVILSIVTSTLWVIIQYRNQGVNVTTVYTSTGLVVQLYILKRIMDKERQEME